MAKQNGHKPAYRVQSVGAIAALLEQLLQQARDQGRGDQVLTSLRSIYRKLQKDPRNYGEPLYKLSGLKLQVRTCAVRPLVVDFPVHEELPMVFIKGAWLLPQ